MEFNMKEFIGRNGDFLYNKLEDFLECEVNQFNCNDIICLLSCENLQSFIYEGNQYLIKKNEVTSQIEIVDEIALENGVNESQAVFKIDLFDLLSLIKHKFD